MKGYYTQILLRNETYKSLIRHHMDKLIANSYLVFNQFTEQTNQDGEFVYRAVHGSPDWGCDKYYAIEMIVNDSGIFVNGKLNPILSLSHLEYIKNYKINSNENEYLPSNI